MKIKKAIRNRFRINTYNWYVADLNQFSMISKPSEKLSGYYGQMGDENFTNEHFDDFPEEIKKVWFRIKKNKKIDYKPAFILSPGNKIAYYIFYTLQKSVPLKEFQDPFELNDKEVYLNAGRTIPRHGGKGVAQYGKFFLFYNLHKMGFEKVHFFVNHKNEISNHISKKLGLHLKYKVVVFNSFNQELKFNLNPDFPFLKLFS